VKQYLLKLFLPGQQNQILCLPIHLLLYSTVKGQNHFEISEKNVVTSVRMSEYLANEHSWGEFYHNCEINDRNVSVTQVCQNKMTDISKRKNPAPRTISFSNVSVLDKISCMSNSLEQSSRKTFYRFLNSWLNLMLNFHYKINIPKHPISLDNLYSVNNASFCMSSFYCKFALILWPHKTLNENY